MEKDNEKYIAHLCYGDQEPDRHRDRGLVFVEKNGKKEILKKKKRVQEARKEEEKAMEKKPMCSPSARSGDAIRMTVRAVSPTLSGLRSKCLAAQRRYTRSKGDPALLETWNSAKVTKATNKISI